MFRPGPVCLDHGRRFPRRLRRTAVLQLAFSLCAACALCCCMALLGGCRRSDAPALIAQASHYRAAGNTAAAMIQLRTAVQEDGANRHARLLLGEVCLEHGEAAAAEQQLRRARALGADPARIPLLLSRAVLMQGKYEEALTELDAHGKDTPRADALSLRADALFGLERKAEALAAYAQALVLHPDLAQALTGQARIALSEARPADALALAGRALSAHPDDIDSLRFMGDLLRAQGKPDGALAAYQRIAALRPQQARALLDMANLHTDAGRFEQARLQIGQARKLALSQLGNGEDGRAVAELERAAALDRRAARTGILLVMTQLRAQAPDKALAAVLEMEKAGDNPLVQNLKGGVLLARHDASGARACFERALQLEPLYLPALANLAQLDLHENKSAQARQRYEAALARAPRNTALMEALSGLELSQGNKTLALAWLERAWRLAPSSLTMGLRVAALSLHSGDAQKALAVARAVQSSYPASSEAVAMLAQAQQLNNNPGAAQELYRQLAVMLPTSPLPHLRLATLHLAQRREPEAMASLRQALALDPDLFAAQLGLLNIFIRQQQFVDAQALAAAAQRRLPHSPQGYKLEGDLLSAQQRHQPALAAYERAFALDNNSAPLIQIHGALLKLGRGAEADARLVQWLHAHPADVAARLYLASSQLVRQDLAAARTQLEAVLAADPHNVLALNDLAWTCQRLGDRRALAYAERAFALAPASAAVMDTLGWIYLDQGKLPRALLLLQKASALAPQASEIRFHFVQGLAKAGDRRGAGRELEKLLAAPGEFPQRAEAAALLARL